MKQKKMSDKEFGRLCDEQIKSELKKYKEEYAKEDKEIKMKVYAICFNGQIKQDLIFSTRELAREHLKSKYDELKNRNLHFHDINEDTFSYYYGWEETRGKWSIKEIAIITEI